MNDKRMITNDTPPCLFDAARACRVSLLHMLDIEPADSYFTGPKMNICRKRFNWRYACRKSAYALMFTRSAAERYARANQMLPRTDDMR